MATKTVAKKPVKKTKKAASKRVATKKQTEMKSFRLYKDEKPFTRMQLSRQTLYWIILLVFVVISQLWLLKIQMDIANLTLLISNR